MSLTQKLLKPRHAQGDDWQAQYERLARDFTAYRQRVEAREARAAKRLAYCRLLTAERIPERFHERIIRLTDLDALALEGDGLRDEADVRRALRREWGDYIAADQTRGVPVDTPPAVARPPRKTVSQIMAIPDDARREREIAENHEMFGF